jgi:hypothetical protein
MQTPGRTAMQDLVYVAVIVAFFAIAGLFVLACDKIIGADETALGSDAAGGPEPEPQPLEKAA